MVEIFYEPFLWLLLALIFNIGHMLFHVAVFRGYSSKNMDIYDGTVGYLGALFVIILVYFDRGTVHILWTVALPFGLFLFILGIIIHLRAHIDFNRYNKKLAIINKGIYRYIKHPMYFGGSLSFIGITIAGRSYLGLVSVWIWVLLVAICGYLEEVKLRSELPNGQYEKYAKSTWI